mmetsp:Transcript_46885/g.132212  ORF Transcript_46885/g.132212 Transcript_46885/m.132212 type:complete len:309 (-) Transcript_46885:72-998(-)
MTAMARVNEVGASRPRAAAGARESFPPPAARQVPRAHSTGSLPAVQKELVQKFVEQQGVRQAQVKQMQGLLQAQAGGLAQTISLVDGIRAELEPQLKERPQLQGQLAGLQQTHEQVGALHQHVLKQLSQLEQTQNQAMSIKLRLTLGQIGSMYGLLQAQASQLQAGNAHAASLHKAARHAQLEVQRVSRSKHEALTQSERQLAGLKAQLQLEDRKDPHGLQPPPSTRVPLRRGEPPESSMPSKGVSTMAAAGAVVMGSPGPDSAALALPGRAPPRRPDEPPPSFRVAELEAELEQLRIFEPASDDESV